MMNSWPRARGVNTGSSIISEDAMLCLLLLLMIYALYISTVYDADASWGIPLSSLHSNEEYSRFTL
jgi:hypothetical protein